jgi:hypothetical protein
MILCSKSFSRTPARRSGGDPERKLRDLMDHIPRILMRINEIIIPIEIPRQLVACAKASATEHCEEFHFNI